MVVTIGVLREARAPLRDEARLCENYLFAQQFSPSRDRCGDAEYSRECAGAARA